MAFLVKTWSKEIRVEGGLEIVEDDNGTLRLGGGRWRGIEQLLSGRPPLEAVQLTQQISGDSGVAHALASLRACEQLFDVKPSEQGLLLRELLHNLAQLHGHMRHFYFQVLPNYLPARSLRNYRGKHAVLLKAAERYTETAWQERKFSTAFTYKEQSQLLEHQAECLNGLALMQRMLALLGGKFPITMSLAPGGLTTQVDNSSILRLKSLSQGLARLTTEMITPDIALLLNKYPQLKKQGKSPQSFLSVGSENEAQALKITPFATGLLINGTLKTLQDNFLEDISHSFYRHTNKDRALVPYQQNTVAYSWIKAPRINGDPLQTGPLSRLAISYLAEDRSNRNPLLKEFQLRFVKPPHKVNHIAARLLACSIECRILLQHIASIITQLKPSLATTIKYIPSIKQQQAWGYSEAPAGSVAHHIVLKRGLIEHYNIISPSTWNGSPLDANGNSGPIESALNHSSTAKNQSKLTVARIINSFGFSTSDAIH